MTLSKSFALLAIFAALLALATPSSGLSWELCDSYASEWVTDSPHLEGKFPFYSLVFSCNGKAPACSLSQEHLSLSAAQ